jgi:hypothetical protein
MMPRSSFTCCSPTPRVGMMRPVERDEIVQSASRGEIPAPGESEAHLVRSWAQTAVVRGGFGGRKDHK